MKNNKFTKEVYDNLKQKLSKNNEYETLLYLILQVEYGIKSDALFLLKYSQVKFPYIENVKYSYPIKGIIPCYVNIEINSGIMDLILKHIYQINLLNCSIEIMNITMRKYLIYVARKLTVEAFKK